jgi:hypothetical protein
MDGNTVKITADVFKAAFYVGLTVALAGQRLGRSFLQMSWPYFLQLQILLYIRYYGNLNMPVNMEVFTKIVYDTVTGRGITDIF